MNIPGVCKNSLKFDQNYWESAPYSRNPEGNLVRKGDVQYRIVYMKSRNLCALEFRSQRFVYRVCIVPGIFCAFFRLTSKAIPPEVFQNAFSTQLCKLWINFSVDTHFHKLCPHIMDTILTFWLFVLPVFLILHYIFEFFLLSSFPAARLFGLCCCCCCCCFFLFP